MCRVLIGKERFKLSKKRVILFHSLHDMQSWRLRLILAFKPLQFHSRLLDLSTKEDLSEAYLSVNPFGTVPVLFVDGLVVPGAQTAAEYLEENRPSLKRLLPRDAETRIIVRNLTWQLDKSLDIIDNYTSQLLSLPVTNPVDERKMKEWNQQDLAKLEALLLPTAGLYSVGDDISLADASLYPRLKTGIVTHGGSIDGLVHLSRIYGYMNKIEEFLDSDPEKQILLQSEHFLASQNTRNQLGL